MWYVYILLSASGRKTYTGYTSDVDRRLFEHNTSETKGYTRRYRPWALMRTEPYDQKAEAIHREKFLKTGRGREEIKKYIDDYLKGAVSAAAEKD